MYKRVILITLISIFLVGVANVHTMKMNEYYNIEELDVTILDKMDLSSVNKLMIVAHPDDETIWGGAHLAEDDYLVVCITNGNNETRNKEFFDVLDVSADSGIMLTYPDKTKGKRDSWDRVRTKISLDLEKIISYKEWELVVTHNTKGEYGHAHHIMTNNIVTNIMIDDLDRLYYFGKYYKASQIGEVEDKLNKINDDRLIQIKNEMIEKYSSQESVTDSLSHMFPYENWECAKDFLR